MRWQVIAAVLGIGLTRAAGGQTVPTPDTTVVVLLGTGMPRPDPAASGPATAVVVGRRVFLFDAGPGVMRRMSAAGLPINGVTALFLTHLHSDHTLGYPDLVLTSWVMGRHTPLAVYGPPGTRDMSRHVMEAWREDITMRTGGLEHEARHGEAVAVHEIEPGVVYDSGGVRVAAIAVQHGDWHHAYGFRVDTPDRHIVISGDTRPSAALEHAARGADVLVHEVYAASRLTPENRPGGEDWPAYMRAFHTSDVELGRIAAAAAPHLLVLTHIIRMGASDAELIAGVRAGGFSGRVVVGHDLERY